MAGDVDAQPSDLTESLAALAAADHLHRRLLAESQQRMEALVTEARQRGATWDQIGERLRMTRQAVQARFAKIRTDLAATSKPASPTSAAAPNPSSDEAIEQLVSGPPHRLADLEFATGGRAGVFTLWIDDQLVWLGYARKAATEARPTNHRQADGATGRVRGTVRQAPVTLQRRLREHFSTDLDRAGGTEQQRARALLEARGTYRIVLTDSGPEAADLHTVAKAALRAAGHDV